MTPQEHDTASVVVTQETFQEMLQEKLRAAVRLTMVTILEEEVEAYEEMPVEEAAAEPDFFTIVEDMPSFPGGEEQLFRYLGENIKYPAMAKDAGITGIVFVTFVVKEDGSVSGVKVLRGIGGGCNEEALRVVNGMPRWKPGKHNGRAVPVTFTLPIKFVLQ